MMKTGNGVLDGEFFNFLFDMEIERSIRYQNYSTLLFIEPDQKAEDEKKFDALVRILREEVRKTDVVGVIDNKRCGIILHNADNNSALIPCKRIQDRMKDYNFAPNDGSFTVSIGGSCCPTDSNDVASLTEMAGAMLELAKKQGGDRIHFPANKEVM